MPTGQRASNKEKIDVLDSSIIKELLANSRKPLTQIAEKFKVSNLTIIKRFDSLKKRGIIRGSSVIVDFAFFDAEGLGALFVNVNPMSLNDFLKEIRSAPGPFSFPVIQKFNKNINLIIVSLVRNFQELQNLKDTIKQHSAVIDVTTNVFTYMKVNPTNLKMEFEQIESVNVGLETVRCSNNLVEIDEIDRTIVEFLYEDSQISFRKIAKETNVSLDTVTRRYQKLIKHGVIQPVIQVDILKLGYQAYVFFGILVVANSIRRTVTDAVTKIPDVVAVMETTGEADLTVIAVTRDILHTFEIGNEINGTKGVRRVWIIKYDIPKLSDPNFYSTIYPPPHWNNLNVQQK